MTKEGEVEKLLCGKGARRISALVDHDHAWAVGFWDSLSDVGYRRDPRVIRYVKTSGSNVSRA